MNHIDPGMPEEHHLVEGTYDGASAEGRFFWFFHAYWPIIIPCSLFLLMIALPLTLSGMMRSPFSAADVVWSGYGLLLIMEFIVAVAIICLVPHLLGAYMLVLSIYGLIVAEHGKAWSVGWVNDGMGHTWMVSSVAVLFLTYVLIGNLVFMNACRNVRKSRL